MQREGRLWVFSNQIFHCLAHSRREFAFDLHCSEVHRDSCPKQEHGQNQLQYGVPEELQASWLMCMLFYKFVVCSTVQLFIHLLSLHSVLGGVESRGVLRKISDMLEVILKRMDSLSKLDNTSTTDARRLDELSSAINRYAKFFLQFYSVSVLTGFGNHYNSYYSNTP